MEAVCDCYKNAQTQLLRTDTSWSWSGDVFDECPQRSHISMASPRASVSLARSQQLLYILEGRRDLPARIQWGTSAAAPQKAPPGGLRLLLLLARLLWRHVRLGDDGGHLAKHDGGVTVEEGDARETLAVLERVDHERLLRPEDDLGHLVGLERVRVLHLLAAGLLADLELKLDCAARRAAAANKADRRVAELDLARDVERLDLGGELSALVKRLVLLVDHHVADARHVLLVEALDVKADVVARLCHLVARVVHLNGEDLAAARVGGGVGRHEDDLLVGLDQALLDAAGEHVSDTLDLVDARNRQAHRRRLVAAGRRAHVVEAVIERVDVHGGLLDEDVDAFPPAHVLRLLVEIVAHPARERQHRHRLLDEVLLPANLDKHVLHLAANLVIASLGVGARGVGVHLVDTDDQLLHAEQVDQARVLASLALHLAGLVVALLDGGGEVTVGRDHEKRDISLGRTGDHVLDEIPVTRRVDDGVVPLLGEELLSGARDGHATLALLLLPVHVEGEGEGRFSETVSLCLELLHLTLRNTAKLEEQATGGGRLARVDVAADDNRHVVLLGVSHGCRCQM
mmetsp:Transcript_29659/g.64907  ORF Transcript_29659/g.64907 Transcript_29659/m.64907 type:complete len:572 (-) Transcript_29659:33-1748(-)